MQRHRQAREHWNADGTEHHRICECGHIETASTMRETIFLLDDHVRLGNTIRRDIPWDGESTFAYRSRY